MHVPHLSAPGLMDPADADSAVSTGAAVSMGMQVTPERGLRVLSECAGEVVCGCMLGRSLPLDVCPCSLGDSCSQVGSLAWRLLTLTFPQVS